MKFLISLCNLCVLCVSVVGNLNHTITTETQRTQRRHREAVTLACFIAAMVLLAGCQKVAFAPVAIEASDMCSFCRMSISEPRYAAELIDNDGQVFKFDDIGCMANFIKQRRNNTPVHTTFVMDFERHEWLAAESALYVRSSEFKTPMNGHIVAFRDQASAESAVAKYHGTLVPLAEVMK